MSCLTSQDGCCLEANDVYMLSPFFGRQSGGRRPRWDAPTYF
jgi:hypothetical protein